MRKIILAFMAASAAMTIYAQTPVISAKKTTATITVDGTINEASWQLTNNCSKTIIGTPNNTVKFGMLWNSQYLYVAYTVLDASLFNDSQNEWDDDGIELYIDADNNGGTTYGANDRQFMKGWNTTNIWEKNGKTTGVLYGWKAITGGYSVEIAVPWSNINITNPAAGRTIGFDVANNDDDNGSTREHQLMWAGDNDNWQFPRNFGDLVLTDVSDTTPPLPPTSLSFTGLTQTSLFLTWSGATDDVGVVSYDIYNNGTKINPGIVATTGFNVTGLAANLPNSFTVTAKDAAGNVSVQSGSLNITIPDITNPAAPANLTASNITASSLDLSWTASTDNVGVTGYDVYQDNVKINSSPVTGTTFNVAGLSASTTYAFFVQATDAATNTTNSTVLNVTTPAPPDTEAPTTVTNLVASNITDAAFTINWDASTDNVGVVSYDVYVNNTKANTGDNTATTYTVTGLSELTTYSVFIRARDLAGNFTDSDPVSVTTTGDITAPSAPSNLAASAITATSLTLTWTAATDNKAVTGYDVYRNGTKINASIVTSLTYNVTGLTASTTYSFFVRALDAAGNVSANSNTVNATTTAGGCTGTGAINFQKWTNVTGTSVTNLTSLASYPNSPSTSGTLTSFEIPTNSSDNYGMRVYGYICPPATGSYTFWIASDDNSELWLSTTSSSANKQRIAYHTQWTNSREWNKYSTQKSAAITLNAGQLYYVEALMKEGSQGDNMAVGWAKPGQGTTTPGEVIPGSNLIAQIPDTQAPTAPVTLTSSSITATSFTLSWSGATDNIGVTGYDVYRNGTKINSSTITATSFNVTGLTATTTYAMTVIDKDAAGNQSPASNILNVTTLIPPPGTETFTQRTVIANQRMPHDLVYGPDNNLWYTERFAGKVSYVNPATGAKTTVLTLGSKMVLVSGQDGLMGLALHPQFLTGKPYVYISYTYQSSSSTVRKTRIERYNYNSSTKVLESPVTILENIPGSNDHNSARLAVGPDLKLYYSVGDMGAGQFDNQNRTENAQNLNVYEGKILRLNTEIIGGSWIPTDNPFSDSSGQKTAVYTFGHRNPQGLVWGKVNGVDLLYSSEHGPYSDDEINLIERGRNYGWPQVAGFCDGNYNGRTIGTFNVINEQNNCATLNVREPLRSIFPSSNPPQEGTDNLTWPSMAPSGTDFYGSTAIPGWQNSLLVAMLKAGTITRFKLSNDGQTIISDTINYFRGKGRFRDVVVSPDGLKLYVACDSSGSTSGPTGGVTSTPANPGSILEFTFVPPTGMRGIDLIATENTLIKEDTRDKTIDVYPNPAHSFIIVYNYTIGDGRMIELMDVNGRLMKKIVVNQLATRINTENLSNGLYILRVTDMKGKAIRTEKMVVQK